MQFACRGCGKTLDYNDFYESNEDGSIPPLEEIKSRKEPRCRKCNTLFLDPFRGCRRLARLKEKRSAELRS